MSSQAIPGFSGGLYVRSGTVSSKVAEITEATLTVEMSEIDVTSFDSNGWVENIPGLKNWSIDAEANYRSNDTTGQTALYTALISSSTIGIVIYPKDVTSAAGYSGSVVITSFEVGVPVDDKVSLSLSLTGTGDLASVTKS